MFQQRCPPCASICWLTPAAYIDCVSGCFKLAPGTFCTSAEKWRGFRQPHNQSCRCHWWTCNLRSNKKQRGQLCLQPPRKARLYKTPASRRVWCLSSASKQRDPFERQHIWGSSHLPILHLATDSQVGYGGMATDRRWASRWTAQKKPWWDLPSRSILQAQWNHKGGHHGSPTDCHGRWG